MFGVTLKPAAVLLGRPPTKATESGALRSPPAPCQLEPDRFLLLENDGVRYADSEGQAFSMTSEKMRKDLGKEFVPWISFTSVQRHSVVRTCLARPLGP